MELGCFTGTGQAWYRSEMCMHLPCIILFMIQAYSMRVACMVHTFFACTMYSMCILFPACDAHTCRLTRIFCLTDKPPLAGSSMYIHLLAPLICIASMIQGHK